MRPIQVKRHPIARIIRAPKVIKTRTRFHAIFKGIDKYAEDVVVVESGVAGYVECGLGHG